MSSEPPTEAPAPLRPLLLVDRGLWGRLGAMVRQLCVGLVDQAARLHVLHSDQADLGDFLGPALMAPIPQSGLRRKEQLLALVEKLPELNADVIHVMGSELMWAGHILHRKLNIPLTAHICSVDDIHKARHQLRIDDLRLMAITTPLLDLAAKKLRLPAERLHLIRPGMRSVAKRGPGTGDRGVFTIFIWAHHKSVRNVETVFKALQKLLTAGRQIMAFVIGGDRYESRLRRSVGALGLHARVTFTPEPHLISLGAGGEDVLILPQPPVELSLQTLGALAAGVVIVAAGAGLHDCLRDDETALMYRQEDHGELALQLDRLLQNRPLARRLADQGQAYVRENHQVSAMVHGVVEVYRAVIAEHDGVRKPVAAT